MSYRIILRATDSSGLTGESSLYVLPRTATIRLDTSPSGLQLTLDGQPVTTPRDVTGVVGVVRTIGAPSPQRSYTFAGWSDGGVQVHTISTPAADTTYRATFDGPTTTTMPVTTTTTSTTTTAAPPTSSTTAPAATTSTSTAPTTTTTTSSSSSTTPPATTTTSTTLAPACAPALTPEAVGCRMEGLSPKLAAVSSDLGRLGPGLVRRLDRATRAVERAAAVCEADQLSRARAALRAAVRHVNAMLARLRSRSGRQLVPTEAAAQLGQLLVTAATNLEALRSGLVCP